MKRLGTMALGVAACALAASAAVADTDWFVSGTLNDGTTLHGYFDINTYGFLGAYRLTTQAGSILPASVYQVGDSTAQTASTIDFQPTYQQDLKLVFTNPIDVAGPPNALLTSSYECVGSFGCAGASGGDRRYIVSGFASAPEPAAWALMLFGVGGVGVSLRLRRSPLDA